jgi:hypothetical protein
MSVARIRAGNLFHIERASYILSNAYPLSRYSWHCLHFRLRNPRPFQEHAADVADIHTNTPWLICLFRPRGDTFTQATFPEPLDAPTAEFFGAYMPYFYVQPNCDVVVLGIEVEGSDCRMHVCLHRPPTRRSLSQHVIPPSDQQRNGFRSSIHEHYGPLLSEQTALLPMLTFMLPHQRDHLVYMLAKEQMQLSAYEMLPHSRLRCQGMLTDLIDIGIDSRTAVLRLPANRDSDLWMPGVKTVTVIGDEVGTGKTLTALSLVAANGARANNPFGIDVPPRSIVPWISYTDYDPAVSNPSRHYSYRSVTNHTRMPKAEHQHIHSRNAQGGGTLLIVPPNVVDHWLAELRRLGELIGGFWRIGVVGKGRLARSMPISPEQLARDYDIVVLPHSQMTFLHHNSSLFSATAFQPGFNWPEPRIPYVHYDAIACAGSDSYLVHMSLDFLESRLTHTNGQYFIDVRSEDTISPHAEIYLLSMPPPNTEAMRALGALPAGGLRLRITHTAVIDARPVPGGPNNNDVALLRPPLYPGLHCQDISQQTPSVVSVLHVRWARTIVDEIHLLISATVRYRYLCTLETDSIVGLTAENVIRGNTDWAIFPYSTTLALSVLLRLVVHVNFVRAAPIRPCAPVLRPMIVVQQPETMRRAEAAMWSRLRAAGASGWQVDFASLTNLGAALRNLARHATFDAEAAVAFEGQLDSLATGIIDNQRERTQQVAAAAAARTTPAAPEFNPVLIRDDPLPPTALAGSDDVIICPICFEEDRRSAQETSWVALVPCHHPLCEECYTNMFEHRTLSRACSLCRRRIVNFRKVAREGEEAAETETGQEEFAGAAGQEEFAGAAGAAAGATEADHGSVPAAAFTPKLLALRDLLTRLCESNDPAERSSPMHGAVVFCEARDECMHSLAAQLFAQIGHAVDVSCILARHSTVARAKIMDNIRRGAERNRPQVLLVRYRICAVGVNFIFADNIIMLTTPHRSDYVHQAVGRLCRLGQTRPTVNVWTIAFAQSFESELWGSWRHCIQPQTEGPTMAVVAQRYWNSTLARTTP